MFNDGALGVNAPLWNKPELHLWVEASSYSDRGLTTGKALPQEDASSKCPSVRWWLTFSNSAKQTNVRKPYRTFSVKS